MLQEHLPSCEEHIFVLDGCIGYAGQFAFAGACVRLKANKSAGPITAHGEARVLIMDSDRVAIKL